MKRSILIVFLYLIKASVAFSDTQYFLSEPSLSPDAETIVFVYEGDLWTVRSTGGTPSRITSIQGIESNPAYSPDGKWLAFTSWLDGNADVFVMDIESGEVKQLTFFDGNDYVESWSWDSEWIFFTSTYTNKYTIRGSYKVSVAGGTPIEIFEGFFLMTHNLVENPNTKDILFNSSRESYVFDYRKHYKGTMNPDIESYNTNTKEYSRLTGFPGKDMWPTIDSYGNTYFVSDHGNGELNLYKLEKEARMLTSFPHSIKKPKVSANGQKIVFEKGYQIFIYDTKTGTISHVPVNMPRIPVLTINEEYSTNSISAFDVSPDGRKLAFVSRGCLFVSDIGGKYVKQIKTNQNERVVEVKWMSDNRTLFYNRTANGWRNLFTIDAEKNLTEKQLTSLANHINNISFNKEITQALFHAGTSELVIMDLSTYKSRTIAKDEFWGGSVSTASFSPDDKYILYSAIRNFEQDLFLFDINNNNILNITNTDVGERNPRWSSDGKFIYFETDRSSPVYPHGVNNSDIYCINLCNYDKVFKSDKLNELFKGKGDPDNDESKDKIVIDFENLENNWEKLIELAGNQRYPFIIQSVDESTVLYTSNHEGATGLSKTTLRSFTEPSTIKIDGANSLSEVRFSNGNVYSLANGYIYKLDLQANKAIPIRISYKFSKNNKSEFAQMFYETWANMQELYYDDEMHGVNWEKVKNYYEYFLPFIRTRDNLRVLINDMLGELNSSHQRFGSRGSEEKLYYNTSYNECGIVFSNSDPYIVERIVKGSPADKYDKNVQPGDQLVAVNGVIIDSNENRDKYFTSTSLLEEITLTLQRNREKFDVKFHPQNSIDLNTQLYNEWVNKNEKLVSEKSKGKIAYLHLRSMQMNELEKFKINISGKLSGKEGLIVDIRYNEGGNIHNEILQTLMQRSYLHWKYRDGKLASQPNFTPSNVPIILLINEFTVSDGELTAAGFKQLGIGKIIGVGTPGLAIFTSVRYLVDGSFHQIPNIGCFQLDGVDIENNGVEPDITIITGFPDKLQNKDPQLDRAVQEILKQRHQ